MEPLTLQNYITPPPQWHYYSYASVKGRVIKFVNNPCWLLKKKKSSLTLIGRFFKENVADFLVTNKIITLRKVVMFLVVTLAGAGGDTLAGQHQVARFAPAAKVGCTLYMIISRTWLIKGTICRFYMGVHGTVFQLRNTASIECFFLLYFLDPNGRYGRFYSIAAWSIRDVTVIGGSYQTVQLHHHDIDISELDYPTTVCISTTWTRQLGIEGSMV